MDIETVTTVFRRNMTLLATEAAAQRRRRDAMCRRAEGSPPGAWRR